MSAPPFSRLDVEQLVANCPPDLLHGKRFVCWEAVLRDGNWTKPPVNSYTGKRAESNNVKTWSPIADALDYYQKHPDRVYGVGRVLAVGDGYVGIDLDDCLDADGNLISTHPAARYLPRFNSYCEESPSGRGIKIWVRGTLRADQTRKKDDALGVEIYSSGRYFTLTGKKWPGSSDRVEERQGVIDEFYAEFFGANQEAPPQEAANSVQKTIRHPGRTKYLVSLAGTMHRRGMDPIAIEAALLTENTARCDPPLSEGKVRAIAHDIPQRYKKPASQETESPRRVLDIITVSTVKAREPEWLRKPYLPLSAITLLSGDPSAGKSWIALSLAASLSIGEMLNEGITGPSSTLYLTIENPLAEVICGRFESLGGDGDFLHVVRGFNVVYGDGTKEQASLTLSDIDLLEEAISKYNPALVVIDPIQSYLGANVDAHRANETRPVLDRLIRLTEKHRFATLILRHLSKGVGGKAIYRGLGTIDMTAAARSELLAGQLPDNPDERALIHVKPFTITGPSLGYQILKEGSWGTFKWTGETTITANDLLCAPTPPAKLELAQEFLKSSLAKGSVTQESLIVKAENEGISKRTLERAKKKLQIKSSRKDFQGHVLWEFPKPDPEPNGHGGTPNGA